MRPLRLASLALASSLIVGLSVPGASLAQGVPTPEGHLGYRPGDDFHLAEWSTVVSYFENVDRASDRVVVRTLGPTTEGRPYIVAVVSSPETVAQLDRYRGIQHRLSHPAPGMDLAPVVAESKAVVMITCSIHSSETASTLMAMELLHELSSATDPGVREILDKTIVLLVPSANPDGVTKVARWYERSKGHPWEGSGMPELYHVYAGHDTNRDWFMLNLKETQLLTHLIYHEWFPTIHYDVHQMGSKGARIFVPPFFDPVNPNLDPRLSQSIAEIGAHMASDLAAAGKRGVLTRAMYDNWWNGGNRTTPQRHNIVAILTEVASVKLASPIFLNQADLASATRGFANHSPAVNFIDPWPGGWWRLRDIVDYEKICARSLLTLAARYAPQFQTNLAVMARDSIKKGKDEPPYAWLVPAEQSDPGRAVEMIRILHETGIEVERATAPFLVSGATHPAGTWILPAAQPYRAHLKDMMERQVYPRRLNPDGTAEPPYDVAGWTLPLQMGVRVVTVTEPLSVTSARVDRIEPLRGEIKSNTDEPRFFYIGNHANDDFIVLNALQEAGVAIDLLRSIDGRSDPGVSRGASFPADEQARRVLERVLPTASTQVKASSQPPGNTVSRHRLTPSRIGLFQPWVPSMDEGWTRLVLEKYGFKYTTLHTADLCAGSLRERVDVLLIPSIEPKTLRDGYAENETEPAYVGGLGSDGADALREFLKAGGTLVCLADSTDYAIEELSLPVKNVLKGLKTSVFYAPGSILRAEVTEPSSLTAGVPPQLSVYFDRSQAFEIDESARKTRQASIIISYAKQRPLESGWLLGPEKLEGKAALVDVRALGGHVILFGFRPQHRGQPHGTFRLLFNALLRVSSAQGGSAEASAGPGE
jgi:hypothetical protein